MDAVSPADTPACATVHSVVVVVTSFVEVETSAAVEVAMSHVTMTDSYAFLYASYEPSRKTCKDECSDSEIQDVCVYACIQVAVGSATAYSLTFIAAP